MITRRALSLEWTERRDCRSFSSSSPVVIAPVRLSESLFVKTIVLLLLLLSLRLHHSVSTLHCMHVLHDSRFLHVRRSGQNPRLQCKAGRTDAMGGKSKASSQRVGFLSVKLRVMVGVLHVHTCSSSSRFLWPRSGVERRGGEESLQCFAVWHCPTGNVSSPCVIVKPGTRKKGELALKQGSIGALSSSPGGRLPALLLLIFFASSPGVRSCCLPLFAES